MSATVFINPLIYIPLRSAQNLQREIRDEYSSRISNMYGRLFKDAIKFLLASPTPTGKNAGQRSLLDHREVRC